MGCIPEHWIGHGGFSGLPPRFQDITPCDLFVMGYIKDQVYRSYISNIGDLKIKERETSGNTSDGVRPNFWSEFEH